MLSEYFGKAKRSLRAALMLGAAGVALAGQARADLYTFDLSSGGVVSPVGFALVTQSAPNVVDVSVTLDTGYFLLHTSGLTNPALGFETSVPVTFSSLSKGFAYQDLGSGSYDVFCMRACSMGAQLSSLTFELTGSGLTSSDFLSLGQFGGQDAYFASTFSGGTFFAGLGGGPILSGATSDNSAPGPTPGAGGLFSLICLMAFGWVAKARMAQRNL